MNTNPPFSVNLWTHEWAQSKGLWSRYFRSTESTNSLAKEAVHRDETINLSIYSTDTQTDGRGRNKNTWLDSGNGSQWLTTWSFKVMQAPQPILTPLLGLALYQALYDTWTLDGLSLKPPNDIYLNKKKMAGILTEVIQQGNYCRVIVGIGMNIHSAPKDLEKFASSLVNNSTQEPLSRESWERFCENLLREFQWALQDGVLKLLTETHCQKLMAAINNPESPVSFLAIQQDGSLQTEQGWIYWQDL